MTRETREQLRATASVFFVLGFVQLVAAIVVGIAVGASKGTIGWYYVDAIGYHSFGLWGLALILLVLSHLRWED